MTWHSLKLNEYSDNHRKCDGQFKHTFYAHENLTKLHRTKAKAKKEEKVQQVWNLLVEPPKDVSPVCCLLLVIIIIWVCYTGKQVCFFVFVFFVASENENNLETNTCIRRRQKRRHKKLHRSKIPSKRERKKTDKKTVSTVLHQSTVLHRIAHDRMV